jgi:hypothetical protein
VLFIPHTQHLKRATERDEKDSRIERERERRRRRRKKKKEKRERGREG